MFCNLALSGGAVKTLCFIGCVKALEEINYIKNFKNYVGTSAGSILALMLVLGYSYEEMKNFIKIKFNNSSVTKISFSNVLNILETYGIDNGNNVTEFIEHMIMNKEYDKDINLIDLTKKTGKNLVVCVCNLSDKKLEYISVDTYPDMKVSLAIRMAISIPLMYQPVIYNDKYYIDAFVYNNFPIEFFNNNINETLGINVYDNQKEIKTFWNFLQSLYDSMFEKIYENYRIKHEHEHICDIELENKGYFDFTNLRFKFDDESFNEYIDIGYNKIKNFIDINNLLN